MHRLAAALTALVMLAPSLLLRSQEAEYHEFTDKRGHSIVALLLDVSGDKRTMKIRREDGQEFETEINILSLDDQQYIKDWLEARPERSDFRLNLTVSRKAVETERHRGNSWSAESRVSEFEIAVTNLSRETLSGARIEYLILWEDLVELLDRDGDDIAYRLQGGIRGERENTRSLHGVEEIPTVAFNRGHAAATAPVAIERILMGSNTVLVEDSLIGCLARVVSSSGAVLAEASSGGSALSDWTWERAEALAEDGGEEAP